MENSEILSIRIVSVDHYTCYPISNLDLCYSEFRGSDIKQVPVIRIFGSTQDGQKICANVHGVFPYLYVPCSERNTDIINQTTYQIASSVDKAINISLGQANSSTQHVFKVSLVKGVPFYGFHKNEHQYFKVYLYNPHFIKRVANLFQNALILGKILQPHDAHIPYILKFFIDYNLYGMSWIHVPKQNVSFRTEDSKCRKRAVSDIEVDFNAINILNRLLSNANDTKKAANPGIESIWEDERVRRKKLDIETPLEQPASQPRTRIVATDSDKYFKGILATKLAQAQSSNDTMDLTYGNLTLSNEDTKLNETKKKFNLKPLIENADYPAEFSQTSFTSSPGQSKLQSQKSNESLSQKEIEDMEQQFLNYTQALTEEDEGVLEIMKLLDENENRNVENDSLLAPLTQQGNLNLRDDLDKDIVERINKTLTAEDQVPDFNEEDSDDELFDQLNFTIPELEVFSQFSKPAANAEEIPQTDGSHDVNSPKKYSLRNRVNQGRVEKKMPARKKVDKKTVEKSLSAKNETIKRLKVEVTSSPSDVARKYDKEHGFVPEAGPSKLLPEIPLSPIPSSVKRFTTSSPDLFASSDEYSPSVHANISILESEEVQSNLMRIVHSIAEENKNKIEEKNEDLDDTKIHSFYENSFINDFPDRDSDSSDSFDFKFDGGVSSDKIVISSSEGPLSQPKSIDDQERRILNLLSEKDENSRSAKSSFSDIKMEVENEIVNEVRKPAIPDNVEEISGTSDEDENSFTSPRRRLISRFRRKELSKSVSLKNSAPKKLNPENENHQKNFSTSMGTEIKRPRFERTRNKTPELFMESGDKEQLQYAQEINFSEAAKQTYQISSSSCSLKQSSSQNSVDSEKYQEESVIVVPKNIPIIDLVSSESLENEEKISDISTEIIITPSLSPPDPEKALEESKMYIDNPIPHYGNANDVTDKREIGHMIFHLPGNKLNDLEEYQSLVFPNNTLNTFQKNQLRKNFSVEENHFKSTQQVKEFLASDKRVIIRPYKDPPTHEDAVKWLKAYEILKGKSEQSNLESDSPIKVRREKVLMCLTAEPTKTPEKPLNESQIHTPQNQTIVRYSGSAELEIQSSQEKDEIGKSSSSVKQNLSYSSRRKNFKLKMSFKKRFNSIMKNRIRDELSKSATQEFSSASPTTSKSSEIQSSQESSIYKILDASQVVRPSSSKSNSPERIDVVSSGSSVESFRTAVDQTQNLLLSSPESSQIKRVKTESPNLFPSSPSPETVIKIESAAGPKNSQSPNLFSSGSSPNISLSNESVKKLLDQSTFIRNANNLDETNFYNSCNITAPSLDSTGGFKMKLESLQTTKSSTEYNFLTIFSVEVHVVTRKEMMPDPEIDEISAIFYSIENDVPPDHILPASIKGVILHNMEFQLKYMTCNIDIHLVNSEMELLNVFLGLVRKHDPDIFAGYEIEMASWGYIVQRAYTLGLNFMNKLSRVPHDKEKPPKNENLQMKDEDDPADRGDYYSEMKIPGRILLDVWRLLRHEIALTSYTFENTMYHILHRRYPKHSFSHLTSMWKKSQTLWIVLDYYLDRAKGTIELLKQLDLIGRTCELAKLFGIQFYEVLSRGSQFRVESMMLRIAKPRNFVPVTPSVNMRAHMRAPEYLPLILEPQSRFYSDPVIVLDFQSLYPSIIIAYNYCFSTCLGRVEHLGQSNQPFEFGVSQLRIPTKMLQEQFLEKDQMTVSPCGVAFVKSSVREGVLPRMLKEILDTRLMVKSSMKIHKNDSALQRVFHSRQLGLKLIANVTYGYTAANFSGRMPCIEVGDSVVSKGRETLERAIKLVEENEEWGCKVVYGDTDSLFVLVPGRSRQEAFKIGEEIAKRVTNENPEPVKLKLEKVYQPCILQTKKRYVGYMYESADQKDPIYEAKGIETVRRDGCPAVAKMLEKSLRILFESCDVSKVKDYVLRQFTKILTGRSNLMDLIIAKEFRGINGYKPKACVPALTMTRKWKLTDPRAEPRRGERVPFVIVNGAPGLPLIRLVRSPLEVLKDENYKINAIYYITKIIIPALNRCFLLVGANIHEWFDELPRKQQFIPLLAKNSVESIGDRKKSTISQYFATTSCATGCGQQCRNEIGICDKCKSQPQKTIAILSSKVFNLERKAFTVQKICDSCCRRSNETDCESLDCPILYVKNRAKGEYKQVEFYRQILDKF